MKPKFKNKQKFSTVSGLLALFLCFIQHKSQAIGFLLPNQDAFAIGRGNAFVATADNPSAVYYNPAGISQISGLDVEVGVLNYIGIDSFYSPQNGPGAESNFKITPVPQIYLTYSGTNSPLSFGIGVYSPFGLGVTWPASSDLRSLAIDSQLTYLTVNPVVSWKIVKSLSIAIGPTINYADIKFNRGLFSNNDFFQFSGDGFSYGLTAGILWQPLDQISIGGNYRLSTTTDFQGNSSYNNGSGPSASAGTSADLAFPQTASVGISYRPTSNWNIEFDLDYINWDTVGVVNLSGTRQIFGQDLSLPLHWRDSFQYKFGVTRYLENGWFVSAGYFYSTETSPSTYFTPAVPDTALSVGSVGVGRDGKNWDWAAAAQVIAGSSRTITPSAANSNPFTGMSAAGQAGQSAYSRFRLFSPTLSLSVGYHF